MDRRYVVIDREMRIPIGTVSGSHRVSFHENGEEIVFSTRAGDVMADVVRNDLGVFLVTDAPVDEWTGILSFTPLSEKSAAASLSPGLMAAADWHDAEAENHRRSPCIHDADLIATWHDECASRMRAAAERAE